MTIAKRYDAKSLGIVTAPKMALTDENNMKYFFKNHTRSVLFSFCPTDLRVYSINSKFLSLDTLLDTNPTEYHDSRQFLMVGMQSCVRANQYVPIK